MLTSLQLVNAIDELSLNESCDCYPAKFIQLIKESYLYSHVHTGDQKSDAKWKTAPIQKRNILKSKEVNNKTTYSEVQKIL